jgi:hypothetical protein
MEVKEKPKAKLEYDANGNKVLWVLKDPGKNLTEALGLLKDWVTTLLTLQTTIIAAVATLVGFRGPDNIAQLTLCQTAVASLAAAASLISIISGVFLLNLLPGAAQREPSDWLKENPEDLFSITTQGKWWIPTVGTSVVTWTRRFRISFLFAVFLLVVFVVMKLFSVC